MSAPLPQIPKNIEELKRAISEIQMTDPKILGYMFQKNAYGVANIIARRVFNQEEKAKIKRSLEEKEEQIKLLTALVLQYQDSKATAAAAQASQASMAAATPQAYQASQASMAAAAPQVPSMSMGGIHDYTGQSANVDDRRLYLYQSDINAFRKMMILLAARERRQQEREERHKKDTDTLQSKVDLRSSPFQLKKVFTSSLNPAKPLTPEQKIIFSNIRNFIKGAEQELTQAGVPLIDSDQFILHLFHDYKRSTPQDITTTVEEFTPIFQSYYINKKHTKRLKLETVRGIIQMLRENTGEIQRAIKDIKQRGSKPEFDAYLSTFFQLYQLRYPDDVDITLDDFSVLVNQYYDAIPQSQGGKLSKFKSKKLSKFKSKKLSKFKSKKLSKSMKRK